MIHTVKIHCDIVDPATGEVIAETGDSLDDRTPKAKQVFGIVVEYPEHYDYRLGSAATHIRRSSLTVEPPTKEVPHQWAEGRGYGYFLEEGS